MRVCRMRLSTRAFPAKLAYEIEPELPRDLFQNAPSRRLVRGEMLCPSNREREDYFLLETGVLKFILKLPDDRECVLALLGANSIINYKSFFDVQASLGAMMALRSCEMRLLSRANFENYAQALPDVY